VTGVDLGPPDGRERWVVEHDGRRFLVLRHGSGWVAVDALCPHRKAELLGGIVRDDTLVCPGHWYGFDLRTGACRMSPDHSLGVYPVREGAHGLVADLPRTVQRSWSEVLRSHARGASVTRAADALMLDIGGVILKNASMMTDVLAESDPRLAVVVEELGLASEKDELWAQMLAHTVTERAYWAQRASDLGAAVDERWDTRTMINRMYAAPPERWLIAPVVQLMRDVRAAGIPLGALTNDLRDFHGDEWVDSQQDWLGLFDVIVDASVTGVLKPDPRAYEAGAQVLGLAPDRIVYLDDMPWNVAGGLRAGLQAVQVSHQEPELAVAEARRRLGLSERN
jgi:putative hydrolase of the HAD superfamily